MGFSASAFASSAADFADCAYDSASLWEGNIGAEELELELLELEVELALELVLELAFKLGDAVASALILAKSFAAAADFSANTTAC